MVGPGMFDGMIQGLIIVGVLIGILLCGFGALLFWIASHLTIGWA